MIAAARKRHRAMIFLLGVVVPIVFVWGIMARRQMPVMPRSEQAPVATTQVGEARFEIDGKPLYVDVFLADGRFALVWQQAPALAYPDILVYWQHGDTLDTAILVGNYAAHSTSFQQEVPEGAMLEDAKIVLYSLAHQRQLSVQPVDAARGGLP